MVNESAPHPPLHKIVLLGSSNVGKTALTRRFVDDKFSSVYEPTKPTVYRKKILLDKTEAEIEILDTPGTNTSPALKNEYILNGEGFLCIFSILDRESFDDTLDFRENVLRLMNVHIPFILVGNKSELELLRKVSKEEAIKRAEQWDVPYVETSAKYGTNVEKVFTDLAKKIAASKGTQQPGTAGSDRTTGRPCCEIL